MAEWHKVSLMDVVSLQRGHDLPEPIRRPGSVPVMGSAGISGYHNIARCNGPGVVIGRSGVGSMGVVSRCNIDYWPLNTVLYVKDFKGNNPLFIYYLLKSVDFRAYNSGSAQASLNRNFISSVILSIPDLYTQDRIACAMEDYERKIQVNQEVAALLEKMTKALFKSWFVDFDPVHANAIDRKQSGLIATATTLFPKLFQETRSGRIPHGWNLSSVCDLLTVDRESITPNEAPAENFAHYSLPAFDEDRLPALVSGAEIKSNKFIISSNCILISKLNPRIPRIWHPRKLLAVKPIASTEFIVCRPKKSIPSSYIYSLLSENLFFQTFASRASGTSGSHQRARSEDLLSTVVVEPPSSVLTAFNAIVGPWLDQAEMLRYESRALAQTRDTVLPMLLSGKLDPPTAV